MSSYTAAGTISGQTHDRIRVGLLGLAGLCGVLVVFVWYLTQRGLIDTTDHMLAPLVTFYLLKAQDLPVAYALAAMCLALSLMPSQSLSLDRFARPASVWVVAAATFVIAWILTVFAHLGFDMSLDEFSSGFQARIFLAGQVAADVPPQFANLSSYMQPGLIHTDPEHGIWLSNYRPGFAALRALSEALGAPHVLNPLLAAIAVLATASVAGKVWPGERDAPLLAALLLALTPQTLLMASANFAYTAYLAFNTVWLALFLRGTLAAHIAAALVGAYAIALHQIHVHPFFAIPFLLALLFGHFGPRWHLLPYVVVYGLTGLMALLWIEIATWLHTGDATAFPRSFLDIKYVQDFLGYRTSQAPTHQDISAQLTPANLLRFVLWLSPALVLMLLLAVRRSTRMPLVAWLCGVSVLLTIAAHHVLMANQMQSWGSRYYNPVLSVLVIFALGAFLSWRQADPNRTGIDKRLGFLLMAGLLIFVPWRGLQVHQKVAPRAAFQTAISGIDAEMVIFRPHGLWFGFDPLRNDPLFENGPAMILDVPNLDLPRSAPGVVTVDIEMARQHGLAAGTLLEPGN